MKTKLEKQAQLLSGLETLGLYTDSSVELEIFAAKYSDQLLLASAVAHEGYEPNFPETCEINRLWGSLLREELGLTDQGYEDMNSLVVDVMERGTPGGTKLS